MTGDKAPFFVDRIVVGELQINCYLFGCTVTHETAIIDPGGDFHLIESTVTGRKAKVTKIILTHGHYDHLGAVREAKQHYSSPILIHAQERETLTNPMANLSALTGETIICPEADLLLKDGDEIEVGKLKLKVLHTPGHSRGSVCLHYENILFSGDLLFRAGIGRTDLPGGSFPLLERSLTARIYTLPEETLVYPGHGEETTIGFEKRYNSFVRAS